MGEASFGIYKLGELGEASFGILNFRVSQVVRFELGDGSFKTLNYKPELELLEFEEEFEVDDKACDKWSKDASEEVMELSKSP